MSFDDVIRLLRLMGLDLDLMLVERDDSDWRQAERHLTDTPEQRHDQLISTLARLGELRHEYQRSVAS